MDGRIQKRLATQGHWIGNLEGGSMHEGFKLSFFSQELNIKAIHMERSRTKNLAIPFDFYTFISSCFYSVIPNSWFLERSLAWNLVIPLDVMFSLFSFSKVLKKDPLILPI